MSGLSCARGQPTEWNWSWQTIASCASLTLWLAPALAVAAGRPAKDGNTPTEAVEASLHPATLGKIEGILDYCAGVSGTAPSKARAASVVGKVPEKDLAEARDSSEYKDSYDEIRAQLDEVPKDQAQKACSDFAKGG